MEGVFDRYKHDQYLKYFETEQKFMINNLEKYFPRESGPDVPEKSDKLNFFREKVDGYVSEMGINSLQNIEEFI